MAVTLITGGAGFIGSHTTDALIREGHHVRILDNLDPQVHPRSLGSTGPTPTPPGYLNSKVEWIYGSVLNSTDLEQALEGVEVIYHFAACTGVGQSMYDLGKYVSTNIDGTALLLEAILKKKINLRRFVLSSSRAVYGEGVYECDQHGVFSPGLRKLEDLEKGVFSVLCPVCQKETVVAASTEFSQLQPVSVYGWTKLAQEELCRQMVKNIQLPLVVLRYFNVYGSRQSLSNPYTGVASVFLSRLKNNNPISIYEQGVPTRDFVHVRDVVAANLKALNPGLFPGATFNVGSGSAMPIARLAQSLGSSCGLTPKIQLTNDFRVGDILSCVADLKRSERLLGYFPEISIERGVAELVAWASMEGSSDLLEVASNELKAHNLLKVAQSKSSNQ